MSRELRSTALERQSELALRRRASLHRAASGRQWSSVAAAGTVERDVVYPRLQVRSSNSTCITGKRDGRPSLAVYVTRRLGERDKSSGAGMAIPRTTRPRFPGGLDQLPPCPGSSGRSDRGRQSGDPLPAGSCRALRPRPERIGAWGGSAGGHLVECSAWRTRAPASTTRVATSACRVGARRGRPVRPGGPDRGRLGTGPIPTAYQVFGATSPSIPCSCRRSVPGERGRSAVPHLPRDQDATVPLASR